MTRSDWYRLFLYVHVLSAIIGLGPTFIFGRITSMGRDDLSHSRFSLGVVHKLTMTSALPLAALIFLSGIGMIWARGYNLWRTDWLLVAMGLFIFGFTFSAAVQSRRVARLIAIVGGDDFDPENPSVELATLRRRISWGGRYLRLSASTILYLMIFKGISPI